jgi:redox-regulated HSP33 family molecular chaperone
MAAPKGNKNSRGRQFTDMLRKVIAADDWKALRTICTKITQKAMAGDLVAAGMIADRLDGKPKLEVDATVDATVDIVVAQADELARKLRGLG